MRLTCVKTAFGGRSPFSLLSIARIYLSVLQRPFIRISPSPALIISTACAIALSSTLLSTILRVEGSIFSLLQTSRIISWSPTRIPSTIPSLTALAIAVIVWSSTAQAPTTLFFALERSCSKSSLKFEIIYLSINWLSYTLFNNIHCISGYHKLLICSNNCNLNLRARLCKNGILASELIIHSLIKVHSKIGEPLANLCPGDIVILSHTAGKDNEIHTIHSGRIGANVLKHIITEDLLSKKR